MQLQFDKRFLQSQVSVKAVRSRSHVRLHDPQLPHIKIVQPHFRRDTNPPVNRLKRSVAMKQIERESQRLIDKRLLALAEESLATRPRRAHVARRWHRPPVEKCFRSRGNI